MSRLEQMLASALVVLVLLAGGWLYLEHFGAERYQAGRDAAIAAGEKLRQAEVDRNRKTESDLRGQLAVKDADAYRKEQEYATNLDAAQRRVRAGDGRLRCPASAVQSATSAGDRPAAARPAADGEGPDLVPEVAAEVLGDGADVAGLVRRYGRLIERFEECRAMNAK